MVTAVVDEDMEDIAPVPAAAPRQEQAQLDGGETGVPAAAAANERLAAVLVAALAQEAADEAENGGGRGMCCLCDGIRRCRRYFHAAPKHCYIVAIVLDFSLCFVTRCSCECLNADGVAAPLPADDDVADYVRRPDADEDEGAQCHLEQTYDRVHASHETVGQCAGPVL